MNMGNTMKATWKIVKKFAEENAPTIVMAIGVGMMVGGTATAVAATTKAVPKVAEENARLTADGQRPMRKVEVVSTCWKLYVPSILLTVGGATCVVAANHMNLTRIAAVSAVAKLNEDKLKEYKAAAQARLGDKEAKQIQHDATGAKIAANPPAKGGASYPGYGKREMLCRDGLTGQYFWANRQSIEHAVNQVNAQLNNGERVTYGTFRELLGIEEPTGIDDLVGWETDINGIVKKPLEVDYSFFEADDGSPILNLDYEAADMLPF